MENRKEILDVRGADGIMGTFLRRLLSRPKFFGLDPQLTVPADAHVPPILVPLGRFVGMAKELDLHLLKLPAAEGVITRIDLVAESFADLGHAERQLKARAVEDVVEVDEDTLRSLGAEIGFVFFIVNRADIGLKHQVKLTRHGKGSGR